MKEILKMQDELRELEFKRRETINSLKENVKTLKDTSELYKERGLLCESDYEFIKTIDIDTLTKLHFEDFLGILERVAEVYENVREQEIELERRINLLKERF